ncbi:hypothetical protein [Azotobacter beijerinckii]|nr:hypothetical protein [Azotobacter beijerinckii]
MTYEKFSVDNPAPLLVCFGATFAIHAAADPLLPWGSQGVAVNDKSRR